jgi:hypothetical protein
VKFYKIPQIFYDLHSRVNRVSGAAASLVGSWAGMHLRRGEEPAVRPGAGVGQRDLWYIRHGRELAHAGAFTTCGEGTPMAFELCVLLSTELVGLRQKIAELFMWFVLILQ